MLTGTTSSTAPKSASGSGPAPPAQAAAAATAIAPAWPSTLAWVTAAASRACPAAVSISPAKYAPIGPARIAPPLPMEPTPSNAPAESARQSPPRAISVRIWWVTRP